MILYHGSLEKVVVPVLNKSKNSNDFGKGFYLTSSKEQAIRWAIRNMKVNNYNTSYVSCFEFNNVDNLKILKFDCPSFEWLNFIIKNRKNYDFNVDYDIIIGPVENDQVYNTII